MAYVHQAPRYMFLLDTLEEKVRWETQQDPTSLMVFRQIYTASQKTSFENMDTAMRFCTMRNEKSGRTLVSVRSDLSASKLADRSSQGQDEAFPLLPTFAHLDAEQDGINYIQNKPQAENTGYEDHLISFDENKEEDLTSFEENSQDFELRNRIKEPISFENTNTGVSSLHMNAEPLNDSTAPSLVGSNIPDASTISSLYPVIFPNITSRQPFIGPIFCRPITSTDTLIDLSEDGRDFSWFQNWSL